MAMASIWLATASCACILAKASEASKGGEAPKMSPRSLCWEILAAGLVYKE